MQRFRGNNSRRRNENGRALNWRLFADVFVVAAVAVDVAAVAAVAAAASLLQNTLTVDEFNGGVWQIGGREALSEKSIAVSIDTAIPWRLKKTPLKTSAIKIALKQIGLLVQRQL